MPVGNIECPLSASLPRDSNHECRVCRVTVVGLSAYANHISSQLHKDNTDAYDREEEGKEEAEEEYFDQELVQLINQRKEQCRQDETSNTAQEPLTDDRRLQRIREDWMVHGARANYDQSGWRINGAPFRDWKWENESFLNSRKGNFPHSAKNPNSSRYVGGTKGHAVWHSSVSVGPKRHQNLGNSGVAWHANRGSSLTWHHNAPGRNHNWNPGSGVSFPTWHPNNTGGNWKATPRGPNGWNDGFPQVRNRLDDMALSWNTKRGRSMKYNQARYPWQREKEDHISNIIPFGDAAAEQCDTATYSMDFTSDCLPPDSAFDFSVHDKSEHKTTKCSGKGTSPSRDKPHRWSPYPSQKAAENQPATENDVSDTPEKDSSFPPFHLPQKISKDNQANISDTIPKRSVKDGPDCPSENGQLDVDSNNPCTEPVDQACLRKSDQEVNKCNRMPSLKSPLLATPDKKRSLQKRDMSGGQKNIKHLFPSSPRESRTNLSALNLETHRPNSYVSKLRSASSRNANNKNTTETSPKEPVESLSEVLRKAKAILQCSQSMRSQHLTKSYKEQSEEASNSSETGTDLHMDFLENVSDGELSDYENSEDPSLLDGSSPCEMPPSEEIGKEDGKTVEISEKSFRASGMASGSQKYSTVEMESLEVPSHLALSFEPALEREANGESFDASEIRKNNDCDPDLQKGGNQQSLLPELSKLGLPVSLQRDLTRHIGPKSKAGTHLPEPNLNNARRIRNVSGHRKSETDKESGLKPTLRQILNASRRNVNWEQVIQHVTKKKQELGKGLPRFGIEMVPPVQNENEGTDLEEELNLSSFEGFHWEAISMPPPGTARKRSLSESSVVLDRSASVYGFFLDQAADRELEQKRKMSVDQSSWVGQGPNGNEELQTGPKREDADQPKDSPTQKNPESPSPERQHSIISLVTTSPIKSEESPKQILENKKAAKSLQEENSVASTSASVVPTINLVDLATDSSCTSGTEQNDNQSVGKKRRATMDGSPEIPSLERKNKRRKIKGKKERSQVDQLLTISLREEELSRSLQGVDTNLLKARAALQAAYVEVQHLMVLKQQINMEMSAMRTQRIQILQGLQETLEHPEQADKHQENLLVEKSCKLPPAPAPVDPSPTNLFSLFLDPPQFVSSHPSPPGAVLGAPLRVGTPPAFQVPSRVIGSNPDSSLPIKQEPPSSRGGKMDTSLNVSIPPVQGGILQTSGSASQSPSSFPTVTAGLSSLTNGFPSVPEKSAASTSKRGSAETHLFSQSSENAKVEGSNLVLGEALLERCTTVEKDPSYPFEQQEQQAESTIASVESKGSKKKKKLRKKKTLRAAHVPDNSDTELDISCNPIRKVKGKKMTKEGKVTTSTSFEQEDGSTALSVERNKDDNDSDSTVEVVEITNPMGEVVDIDSEPGDPKPDSPSKREPLNSTEKRLLEVASSGNDEVSSTSEMGAKYRNGVLRSATETQTTMSSVRSSKNSSEVSSEPGEDEEPTEGIFEGHQAAVNAIQIFGGLLYTCSADKTVRAYNMVNRKCVAIFEGHTSKVNCLLLTLTSGKNSVLYTGSSDHTIRCYNIKSRECTNQFQLDDRVVCLHARWRILYGGLANGNVVTFGIKSGKQLDTFECHGPRAVSCLASAQEGARRLLLVGSYDCTISVRDARNGLLLRTLEGHSKTVLCMKVVNDLVFSGSSDQSVHAHNIHTGELVRIYKGHNHAVTVVNILGKVMVTASLDKFVRVYELQSHDRLQVYGGHTDMIMCMAIHKSMIYTGCYDGSIQAVRLNLLQNYRCWWHGCSLIFGVVDHLKQHLLTDHTNPNFQTLKCRWKNCDAFFTARRGSKQDAPGHIERHAEEDSKMDT